MRNLNSKDNGTEIDHAGWTVTFGDLSMLLLTFFVMLLAMSSLDMEALKPVLSSFSGRSSLSRGLNGIEASHGLVSRSGTGPMGLSGSHTVKAVTDRIDKIVAQKKEGIHITSGKMLEDFFACADMDHDEKLGGSKSIIDISEDERGVIIILAERVLFNSAEAEINPTMFPILDSIAKVLGAVSNKILIMGHSDNVPIHKGRYGSNWDLSLYRALNVHSYFVENKGLSPKRFAVGGYGDIRPLSPHNTREARDKNRRVEIILKRAQN